jgi:hypothetical protein
VTARAFRTFALSLLEATEGSHMGHADFRVRGKIFASLGPREDWAMVKLPQDEQADLLEEDGEVYQPASGAWGLQGCTIVQLRSAKAQTVRGAVVAAWRKTAPKTLVREYDRRHGPRQE